MSREETQGLVTWRTAVAALVAAAALTAGAVVGFVLAGRGGGLARADPVLSMIPEGALLVGSADVAGLRKELPLREALRSMLPLGDFTPSPSDAAFVEFLSGRFELRAGKIERLYYFVRPGRTIAFVLEGELRAGDLVGPVVAQHHGVEIRRAGPLQAASLGSGRVVLADAGGVTAVLDVARAGRRGLAADPGFAGLRELAVEARGHATAEMVVLRGPGLASLGTEWAGASAAGGFLKVHADGSELLGLVLADPARAAELERSLRSRLGGRAELERREGLLRVRLRGRQVEGAAAMVWLLSRVLERLGAVTSSGAAPPRAHP